MVRRPAVVIFAVSFTLTVAVATAGLASESPAGRGAQWLASRQVGSGAIPDGARPDEVAEAVVALVAGAAPQSSIDKAMAFVADRGEAQTKRGAYVGRVIVGALASKRDPRALGGVDYVARLDAAYNATTGTYDSGVYSNALAFLGKLAAGGKLTPASRTYLSANQCSDGGFAHDTGCTRLPDVDTTALALRVLIGDGADASARDRARDWLARAQNNDGGFPLDRGGISNANSTGLALVAIGELGAVPSDAPWKREGGTPLEALLRLQTSTGSFRFVPSGNENLYATVQAVPGIARFMPATAPTAASAPPTPGAPSAGARPLPPSEGRASATTVPGITPTIVATTVPERATDGADDSAEFAQTPIVGDFDQRTNGPLSALAAIVLAGVIYAVYEQRRRLGSR